MKNFEKTLVNELAKNGNFTLCNGEITFHAKKVEVKKVNGTKMVVVNWTQDFNEHINNGGKDAHKGIVGFYLKKNNNMRVVNFDHKEMKGVNFYVAMSTDENAMFDVAGAVVKHICDKIGCFSRYDRHNPNTFDVVYI